MCRMLVVVEERPGALKGLRGRLYSSLAEAARYDPHSARLFGEEDASHRDGWGMLSAEVGVGGVESYRVYRSLKPVFEDEWPFAQVEGRGPSVEILHARAASSGMPVNIFSVHPVEAQSPEGHRLFLAHNGSVDKWGLAKAVGAGEADLKLYNDTYFLAKFLAARSGELVGGRPIFEASRYTETAMNIAFLLLSERWQLLGVGSYYRHRERRDYYRLYVGRGGGFTVYASSTIVDYYDPLPGLVEWAELPNGSFELYRIGRGEIAREGRITLEA